MEYSFKSSCLILEERLGEGSKIGKEGSSNGFGFYLSLHLQNVFHFLPSKKQRVTVTCKTAIILIRLHHLKASS